VLVQDIGKAVCWFRITAVVVENRPVREVAAAYGVSQSWLNELLARYRAEGETVFEPRSRHPRSSPTATPAEVVELFVELREKLTRPAWTPARTPSPGAWPTTTTSPCPGPCWPGTDPGRAGDPGARSSD
jgi:hypothetical protein